MTTATATAPAMTAIITPPCVICGECNELEVPTAGLEAYLDGASALSSFPDLPVDDREMLVTGIHPACWKAEIEGARS